MVQASEETEKQDLPQAFRLLGEMNNNVLQVTQLVDSMLVRVKNGEMSTDKGLSFLEMKYNMLLSYLINLTYIVLRKCSGEKIESDPVIERLIEVRTVLEKIRPIDSKLKYQVDKVVKSALTNITSNNEAMVHKAHPENLVSKVDEGSDNDSESSEGGEVKINKSGKYIPPKLAAVHYAEDESIKEKEIKQVARNKKKVLNSSVMRELREEYMDTPTEISTGGRHNNALSKFQQEKEEYEETYLTRLPVTKSEKHRQKRMSTIGSVGDEITRFGGFSSEGSQSKKRKRNTKKKGSKKRKFF